MIQFYHFCIFYIIFIGVTIVINFTSKKKCQSQFKFQNILKRAKKLKTFTAFKTLEIVHMQLFWNHNNVAAPHYTGTNNCRKNYFINSVKCSGEKFLNWFLLSHFKIHLKFHIYESESKIRTPNQLQVAKIFLFCKLVSNIAKWI